MTYFYQDLLLPNLLLTRPTFTEGFDGVTAGPTFNETYFYRTYFYRESGVGQTDPHPMIRAPQVVS